MADRRRSINKTADFTITPHADRPETTFTNAGAQGAIVGTLPPPTAQLLGVRYHFLGVADQNFTIATATADTLLTKNDATADSVAISSSGEKIGAHATAECFYNGSAYRWAVWGDAVGHTFTVATN